MSAAGITLAFIFVFIVVAAMYKQYANWRSAPWYSTFTVCFTWFICLSVVFLIPMDISSTYYRHCIGQHTPASSSSPIPSATPFSSSSSSSSASASISTSLPSFTATLTISATTADPTSPLLTESVTTATATPTEIPTSITHNTDMALPFIVAHINTAEQQKIAVESTTTSESIEEQCEKPWTYISPDVLPIVWSIVYWSSQLLTWLVLPFMQSYVDAGDFTFWTKMRTSIKENLIVYGSLGILVIILFVYIAVKSKLSTDALLGIAMAASNTWGLFLLIGLMGVGLVEIPRSLWNESRVDYVVKYLQFKASKLHAELDDAEDDLSETLSDVKKISQKIKFTHHLRPYVDEILFKCPSNTEDVASRANLHSKTPAARKVESSDEGDITLKSLAKLHRRLIRNSLSVRRSHALYERCMDQALELEELLEHKDQSWLTFSSHVSSSYRGPFKNFVDRFVFLWKLKLRRLLYAFFAIVFGLFSIAVIWSEITFFKTDPTISLYAILMNTAGTNFQYSNVEIFSFFSISYMAICAYSTIFRIRFFNFYYLVKHQQTDDSSLLFSALFLSRLAPSLCLNFLSINHLDGHVVSTIEEETAFTQIMGHMDVVSFIQDGFNVYFPIFILLVAVSTWFHCCGRLLSCVGMTRFLDNDDVSNDAIIEGRELIKRERRLRERALNGGANSSSDNLSSMKGRKTGTSTNSLSESSFSKSSSINSDISVRVDSDELDLETAANTTANSAAGGGWASRFKNPFSSSTPSTVATASASTTSNSFLTTGNRSALSSSRDNLGSINSTSTSTSSSSSSSSTARAFNSDRAPTTSSFSFSQFTNRGTTAATTSSLGGSSNSSSSNPWRPFKTEAPEEDRYTLLGNSGSAFSAGFSSKGSSGGTRRPNTNLFDDV